MHREESESEIIKIRKDLRLKQKLKMILCKSYANEKAVTILFTVTA